MTLTLALRCLLPTLALVVGSCARPGPAVRTSVTEEVGQPSVHLPPLAPPVADAASPAELPGVHNVVAFGDALYSGSVPHGAEGFESLARLGIRTVISVDGAVPEVDEARRHGLRYVHLPISYGGIDEARALEIARAVNDLPGPVFVHCHHGKHRSAAAAGAAAVTLGRLTPDEAKARMKVSGTAETYPGLYRCVAVASPANKARLSEASNAFPSVTQMNGLVQGMVVVDEAFDALKAIEKAGWTTPADHPDLVPAAEAGRLADTLRQLAEGDEARGKSAELVEWLSQASAQAADLEQAVASHAAPGVIAARMKAVGQSCKSCHAKYRD